MQLPGGLWQQDRLQREAEFRPVDGHLEMALAAAATAGADLPGQVSAALLAALARIGDSPVGLAQVDGLSVADRQFLMLRLAEHLGMTQIWLSASCGHCGAWFDFPLVFAQIPVKPAAQGYPFTELVLTSARLRLRVPTGADQRAVAGIANADEARQVLARRCVLDAEPTLSAQDVDQIEAALEALAPELASHAAAQCPECAGENAVAIDPYCCLGRIGSEIFVEVHQLAQHYHWSEAEILGLPRWRRKTYLALIDRARGMTT